jgi:hypothetical protein
MLPENKQRRLWKGAALTTPTPFMRQGGFLQRSSPKAVGTDASGNTPLAYRFSEFHEAG